MKKSFTLTLLLSLTCAIGFAQWSKDSATNTPVSTAANYQNFPRAVPDGAGGMFVCWASYNGSYFGNIYAQHFNKSGVALWTKNGITIDTGNHSERPRIVADGSGGIIVAWIDHRYLTADNNEEADIYVQKINTSGHAVWKHNGVALDSNGHTKAHISMVGDGKGGAYLAWDEFAYPEYNANMIFTQHVNSSGEPVWGGGLYPPRLSYPTTGYAYEPQLVVDGRGGFIATWYDSRYSEDNIFAQRVDSSGNKAWQSDDVPVCTAAGGQQYPRIVSDGNKGAIIVWSDGRAGAGFGTNPFDVYAQKLNADGTKLWTNSGEPSNPGNGIQICTTDFRQFFPQITSDSAGGAYICWADEYYGYAEYMQRVNSNGDTVFKKNGIEAAPHGSYTGAVLFGEDADAAALISDNTGNAILVWPDVPYYNADHNIRAQKISKTGALLWKKGGVPVCTAVGSQDYPQLIPGANGNAIAVWTDYRDTVNYSSHIYTSLITSAGTLPVSLMPLAGNYIKNAVELQWQTATETNSKYFAVERGATPVKFDSIGIVTAAGNSTTEQHYTFMDGQTLVVDGFYRLKMVDKDGRYTYSNTIIMKPVNAGAMVHVYPNPASGYITINMPGLNTADRVTIYDAQGKAVKQWQRTPVNTAFNIAQLTAGQYTVTVVTGTTTTSSKIVVQ